MKKVIPFEKLSKKKQRQLNAQKRRDWGGLNPVTRRPENPKAYNRRKAQSWKKDSSSEPFSSFVKYGSHLDSPTGRRYNHIQKRNRSSDEKRREPCHERSCF